MNNNTMTKFEQQTANALRLIGTNLGCLTTAVSRLEPKEPGNDNNMARIADALEQLVEVAEACRLNHVESLTCGELMEGVTFSTEAQHEDVGDGETLHSFVRLALQANGASNHPTSCTRLRMRSAHGTRQRLTWWRPSGPSASRTEPYRHGRPWPDVGSRGRYERTPRAGRLEVHHQWRAGERGAVETPLYCRPRSRERSPAREARQDL